MGLEQTQEERDKEAAQILRGYPEAAFAVHHGSGELYARKPDGTIIMYTGDFREMDGPQIRDFLAAAFARGD